MNLPNTEEFLNEYAVKMLTHIQEYIESEKKRRASAAGGQYVKTKFSDKVYYNTNKDEIEWDFPEYSEYMDKGRGPGKMPPLKAISDWTSRNNIPDSAIFPIRKKIAEEGTTGYHFTDLIWDDMDNFLRELEKVYASDIGNNLGELW